MANDIRVWRVMLRSRAWPKNLLVQILKYIEWVYKVVVRMRREELTIVHAHNVATLPAGVLLKWLTGAPLVYDAHELESETNGLSGFRSRLTRLTEGLWIRAADGAVTVCDSIADWYEDTYGMRRPIVVRNIPVRDALAPVESAVLRELHGVRNDELLFLYQGALSPGRGIGQIIETFRELGPGKHLVLMGYGVLEKQAREAAEQHGNIHFQPAVPPEAVQTYTSSADVGICLIENTCLSYYYSLPNKLFEYLMCGLPVLVNDLPEQRRIIEEYDCGWIAPESSAQTRELISSIGRDAVETMAAGALRAGRSFSWTAESKRLLEMYTELAGNRD
jgi:glycosyltransferase involved in cell wall biosynthesis